MYWLHIADNQRLSCRFPPCSQLTEIKIEQINYYFYKYILDAKEMFEIAGMEGKLNVINVKLTTTFYN